MDDIKPATKWDPSVLRDEWVYRSGDKIMIRLKSWELKYPAIYAAVALHFPNGDFEVAMMPYNPPFGGYSFILTSADNIDVLKSAVFTVPSAPDTVLRKVPKYKMPRSEHANILTGKVPRWVTPGELYRLFSRFNSSGLDTLPEITLGTGDIAKIVFSDSPAHADDGSIARAMVSRYLFTDPRTNETVTVKFSHFIDDLDDFLVEKQCRQAEYLEYLKTTDTAKYRRELAARESHRAGSRCSVGTAE